METISLSEKFTQKRNQVKIVENPELTDKLLQNIVTARKNLEFAEIQYKKQKQSQRKIYSEEISAVDQDFKFALFKEYGMENNPKREKIFSIAWEKGHSDGYNGVECEFSTLAELMQ